MFFRKGVSGIFITRIVFQTSYSEALKEWDSSRHKHTRSQWTVRASTVIQSQVDLKSEKVHSESKLQVLSCSHGRNNFIKSIAFTTIVEFKIITAEDGLQRHEISLWTIFTLLIAGFQWTAVMINVSVASSYVFDN